MTIRSLYRKFRVRESRSMEKSSSGSWLFSREREPAIPPTLRSPYILPRFTQFITFPEVSPASSSSDTSTTISSFPVSGAVMMFPIRFSWSDMAWKSFTRIRFSSRSSALSCRISERMPEKLLLRDCCAEEILALSSKERRSMRSLIPSSTEEALS